MTFLPEEYMMARCGLNHLSDGGTGGGDLNIGDDDLTIDILATGNILLHDCLALHYSEMVSLIGNTLRELDICEEIVNLLRELP
jgi:hypothetical protein